jgi:nitrate/nitrite transport system permease protein
MANNTQMAEILTTANLEANGLVEDLGSVSAKNTKRRSTFTLERVYKTLKTIGLGFIIPVIKLISGDEPLVQLKLMWNQVGIPVVAFSIFLLLWGVSASNIKTSLGQLPGPIQVFEQAQVLWQDHLHERQKSQEFYARQEARNAKRLAKNPQASIKAVAYTGKPTYIDQIFTSLQTVFLGFFFATLVALPIGIFMGLSKTLRTAINPLIQIFKPVSPLAWLPIVTMVISATYTNNDGWFQKSFLISAITVSLCSMWATVINTALGVSSVDKDYINVARVLNLNLFEKIFKVIIPASLPLIFTGLRISLGVGWMVLIAAEMLAQNPGLGKFVWDEFQNGSSSSLAKIMVAVFTIGLIGFFLDQIMVMLQRLVTFDKKLV